MDEPEASSVDRFGDQQFPETIDGRYTLVRKIGEGGMGVVYEATHVGLQRRVALKLLTKGASSNQRRRERFTREARALACLQSPHVVAVTDFGSTREGSLFLVMEYLDGVDLRRLLSQEGKLSVPRTLKLIGDAIRGVQATHREGFVHRDLKPENLFISRDEEGAEHCRLLDFGMVKTPDARTFTQDGVAIGTAGYMAPEQVVGYQDLDFRADVFALGAILFECLAGRPAFTGNRTEAVLFRTMLDSAPSLSQCEVNISDELCGIVDQALARDPDERFGSVRELGDALSAVEMRQRFATASSAWTDEDWRSETEPESNPNPHVRHSTVADVETSPGAKQRDRGGFSRAFAVPALFALAVGGSYSIYTLLSPPQTELGTIQRGTTEIYAPSLRTAPEAKSSSPPPVENPLVDSTLLPVLEPGLPPTSVSTLGRSSASPARAPVASDWQHAARLKSETKPVAARAGGPLRVISRVASSAPTPATTRLSGAAPVNAQLPSAPLGAPIATPHGLKQPKPELSAKEQSIGFELEPNPYE